MQERPTIETPRLILRPFSQADAPCVQKLAADRDIASTTLYVPHPYEDGMAEQWIATHQQRYEQGEVVNFAIISRQTDALVGTIDLELNQQHARGELGYWIGRPYWNSGYATEAAVAVLRYGFEVLALNRIHASHFRRNPASGRVMQKIGMTLEGCLRQHIMKWGVAEDVMQYGITRFEYRVPVACQ